MAARRHAAGFSLFEFAVVVIVFGLVMMVVLQRASFYGEEGDKAAVQALVMNMRSALQSRVLSLHAQGKDGEIASLAGANPVAWLERPPQNYRGELGPEAAKTVEAGSWYFDVAQHQLIYILEGNKHSFKDTKRICFRVESLRLFPKNASAESMLADVASVAINQVQE